jgi:hypothetical protein
VVHGDIVEEQASIILIGLKDFFAQQFTDDPSFLLPCHHHLSPTDHKNTISICLITIWIVGYVQWMKWLRPDFSTKRWNRTMPSILWPPYLHPLLFQTHYHSKLLTLHTSLVLVLTFLLFSSMCNNYSINCSIHYMLATSLNTLSQGKHFMDFLEDSSIVSVFATSTQTRYDSLLGSLRFQLRSF